MDSKLVAIKGPAGKYARADEPNTGPFGSLNRGWRGLIWDGADRNDARYQFQLTKPDAYFQLVHVQTGDLFGIDATQFSGDIGAQFYLKPAAEGRAGYESPSIYDGNQFGALTGQVEYSDPSVGKFVSCAFVMDVIS